MFFYINILFIKKICNTEEKMLLIQIFKRPFFERFIWGLKKTNLKLVDIKVFMYEIIKSRSFHLYWGGVILRKQP